MKITFKQFKQAVDLPEDITEEQLDEIFGIFKNNDKLEKAKAEREALLKKLGPAQYALRVKQNNLKMAKAGQKPAAKPAPRDSRSAAGGRAAELDWVKSMQSEGLTEAAATAIEKLARSMAKSEVNLPKHLENKKPDATIKTGLKSPEFSNKLEVWYDKDASGEVKYTYFQASGEYMNTPAGRAKGKISVSDLKAAYKIAVMIGSDEEGDIGFK